MAASDQAGPGHQASRAQPSESAVIAGVTELLPTLRQRAQETEDARVVPAESVKSLEETGFFRLLQPKSAGGLEADPVTFFTVRAPLVTSLPSLVATSISTTVSRIAPTRSCR
jgi:alkylation response protein AidB-like acyl-CoA dehydrogenase